MDLIRGGAAVVVAGLVALLIMLPQALLGTGSRSDPDRASPSLGSGTSEVTTTDAPEDLARVAALFVDFASGERVLPPSEGPLDLYVGGQHQRRLVSIELRLRGRWTTCPTGGYAGRTCPLSAIDELDRMQGRLAFTNEPPAGPCVTPRDTPADLADLRGVTISPVRVTDCSAYAAVRLYVDDTDRLRAVDLVLAS